MSSPTYDEQLPLPSQSELNALDGLTYSQQLAASFIKGSSQPDYVQVRAYSTFVWAAYLIVHRANTNTDLRRQSALQMQPHFITLLTAHKAMATTPL